MIEYEFINFSDPYTFKAENCETAALVVLLAGPAYGAETKDSDPELHIPIFLVGGDPAAWYKEKFGRTPVEGLDALKGHVADAFASFMLGGFEDRARYEAALKAIDDPEKRKKFIEEWQDGRSSLNDIGTWAHSLADKLREAKA